MKITAITAQANNQNRVNVMVDGAYRFSLDIFQVSDLGIRVGKDYSEEELKALEDESVFGKLYARALEYTMIRPHSAKEIRDYLWRKTRDTRYRDKKSGELRTREGVSREIADKVYDRLDEKRYIDDEKFAEWWIENRNIQKGTSVRKLQNELRAKGVSSDIINETIQKSTRDEKSEIMKIIAKKASKYDDEQKLIAYLARRGFSYDDITAALAEYGEI